MSRRPVRGVLGKLTGYAGARVESDTTDRGGTVAGTRGRLSRALAVVLAVALVGSILAPAVAFAASTGAAAASGPSGHVGVPAGNVGPPDHANARGGPSGPAAPPSHALENVPSHAGFWEVSASRHAGALEVVVGADAAGSPVLFLEDGENHAGREVAVSRAALASAVGYEPSTAFGVHSSGDRWSSEVEYVGEKAVFEVPEFSSNTVTFEGAVEITGDPATDGSSYQYDVSSLDAVENFSIDVTGGVASGSGSASGTASDGDSSTFDVGGNLAPSNGSLTVTNNLPMERGFPGESDTLDGNSEQILYDSGGGGALRMPNPASTLENVTVHIEAQEASSQIYGDIYLVEGWDGTHPDPSDGVKVKSDWTPDENYGDATPETIEFDQPVNISEGVDDVALRFAYTSGGNSVGNYVWIATLGDSADDGDGGGTDRYGQQFANWTAVEYEQAPPVEDVSASTSGDSATFGTIPHGDSATEPLAVSSDSGTVSFSTGGGSVDWSLEWTEHTESVDPTVEVNGETTSYSGTLADGETASLSTDPEWIREGSNRVNVSLSTPSSGPTPEVGLAYSHEATDRQSVEYSGETWSERYNVSRTFSSDRSGATLTIPFSSDRVVAIRGLETRVDGGSWTAIDEASRSFDGAELTAALGDVAAGETVEVRATASKVKTTSGAIRVLEPTVEGDDLDTKVEAAEIGADGLVVDVSGTSSEGRLHYAEQTTWSDETFATVSAGGGQVFHAASANQGSTMRVRTMPVSVVPESGAMEALVEDPDPSEPRFRLREGDAAGASAVEVGYFNTLSGERYVLYDETAEREVDADRAESPAWFRTDGSDRSYSILQRDARGGGSDGGSPAPAAAGGVGMLLVFPAVALSVGGLWFVGRRYGGATGVRGNAVLLVGSTIVAIVAAEAVTPRSLTSDVVFALGDALASGAGAVIMGLLVLVGLWYLDQRTRASVPPWLMGLAAVLVAIMSAEAIRPGSVLGALEGVLTEIGAAVVLISLVGLLGLLWRRASTPENRIVLGGGEEK